MVTRRVSEALTAIPRLRFNPSLQSLVYASIARLRFGLPLNQQALALRVGILQSAARQRMMSNGDAQW